MTALPAVDRVAGDPTVVPVLILGREVAVTVMRSALARHGMIPASRGGKLT